MKDSEEDLGLRSGYPGALPATWRIEKEPQRRPFWFLTSSTRLGVVSGSVDDMASPQETDLCYAWEKYMDCRLQGADLQVWRFWQECNFRDHSLGGGAAYFLQEQVLKIWCHCTWERSEDSHVSCLFWWRLIICFQSRYSCKTGSLQDFIQRAESIRS